MHGKKKLTELEGRRGTEKYQVVDGACADGVYEVDDELDDEDADQEGRHCEDARDGLRAHNPMGAGEKGK